tara:strand:+ start:1069 stop:1314 length:246 start_codon:yes stop_codon:yes gene_type:complete
MSTEVHKYIEEALEKNQNLFDAEVINFPKEKKLQKIRAFKTDVNSFWKINDEANDDQLKAVIGLCFMFGALIVLGLYSNLA